MPSFCCFERNTRRCNALACELACYFHLRSKHFYAKTFNGFLAATTACVVLLPLLLTGTTSFEAASGVCYERTFQQQKATFIIDDVDSPQYRPDWSMDDTASWALFPAHLFNSIATIVSLSCFWVWFFFSPHSSNGQAEALDRTCESQVACNCLDFANSLPTSNQPISL
jgi:hypothetical protein